MDINEMYGDRKTREDRLGIPTIRGEFRKVKKVLNKYIWWFIITASVMALFGQALTTYNRNYHKDTHVEMMWVKN